ncbi:MAG: FtsX-like permease family protein [Chitinophagaceae bacterium]
MTFLFAWRYFKAKKTTNAINVIAWISVGAIVIGTASLILVLSVFNGFEGLVKSLYSSFYTDLKVIPESGKVLTLTPQQLEQIKGTAGIRNITRIVEEKALLQSGENQTVAILKAADDQYRYVTDVADYMVRGSFDLGTADEPMLVLGVGLEGALGILSDQGLFTVRVILPRKGGGEQLDPLEDISIGEAQPKGSFFIQQDFDNKYALTNIAFAQRALRMGENEYSALEIRVTDPANPEAAQAALQQLLGKNYKVQTRYQQNQSLYSVMNIERWIIYGVLSLILVVGAFNMIGALTMLVLEKQQDIRILHAMGASRSFIQRIFLSEGFLLASIGGIAGMLIALLLALVQINFHVVKLQGGSFLIDYFPISLRWTDFLLVGGTVFVIALLASWIPARKAALQQTEIRES